MEDGDLDNGKMVTNFSEYINNNKLIATPGQICKRSLTLINALPPFSVSAKDIVTTQSYLHILDSLT